MISGYEKIFDLRQYLAKNNLSTSSKINITTDFPWKIEENFTKK